jgi:hypothetical protein
MTVLTRSGSDWRRRDLVPGESLAFCRETDPVNRVVIIFSNADTALNAFEAPMTNNLMTTYHNGCGYIGTSRLVSDQTFVDEEAVGTDLVFAPAESDGPGAHYELLSGSITYSFEGDPFGTGICTLEGSLTFAPAPGEAHIDVHGGSLYTGLGFTDIDVPVTIRCPGQADIETTRGTSIWFDIAGNAGDPNHLQGEKASDSFAYEWNLTRGSPPDGGPAD